VEDGDCETVLKCSDANMFPTFAHLLGLLEQHLK
jgi:hypothetical protein